MSKAAVISIVVVVVVLAGGGALLAANRNSNKKSDTTNTTSTSNMNTNSSSSTSSTPSATNSVTIDNFAFSPADITIKKGTMVTWTNKDSATHTVTETDGKTGPDSGSVATNASYRFTYNSVGTFKYHCSIHPDMTGTVTVTE